MVFKGRQNMVHTLNTCTITLKPFLINVTKLLSILTFDDIKYL